MDKTETAELVKHAQAGDTHAYERLLSTHYSLIFRTAWKWCGHAQDAEDITQNVCLKLARSLHQFRGEAAFSSWLYRLTINAAKDDARRKSRRREEGPEALERFTCHATDPEQSVIGKRLYWCISHLSDKLREAVLLVCAEGLSHAEAADALTSKEGTISWRIAEARKQLALCMEGGRHGVE